MWIRGTVPSGFSPSPFLSSESFSRESGVSSNPEGNIARTPASSSAATVRRDSDAAPSAAATTAAPSGASRCEAPSVSAASATGSRGHPRNAARSSPDAHVWRSLRHKNARVSALGWPFLSSPVSGSVSRRRSASSRGGRHGTGGASATTPRRRSASEHFHAAGSTRGIRLASVAASSTRRRFKPRVSANAAKRRVSSGSKVP